MDVKILLDNTYLGLVKLNSFISFNSLIEYGKLVASYHNKVGYMVDIYLNRDNKLDLSRLDPNINLKPYYHLFTDPYLYIYKNLTKIETRGIESLQKDDETFWRLKTEKDFPNSVKRQNTWKNQYLFLSRILAKHMFDHVIEQSQYQSGPEAQNIFDILYGLGIVAWGVLLIDHKLPIVQELIFLHTLMSDRGFQYLLSDKNIENPRDFINAMKLVPSEIIGKQYNRDNIFDILANGEYQNIVGKSEYYYYMIDYLWDSFRNLNPIVTSTYKIFSDYFRQLLTLEERLQNCIIEKTETDVRKIIRKHQEEIIGEEDYMYNNDDIEFLQILHDNIRNKQLKIFDTLDYEFIISKIMNR